MSDDLRARADARLEQALATAPIQDPRPHLRPILKHLKERDPGAYERALAHLQTRLIPDVAVEGDPLAAWLDYGSLLAGLAGPGRAVAIDGSGRAHPADGEGSDRPVDSDDVLLHIPDAPETPAVLLRCPRETTPAQAASIDLLVLGRVA